MNSKKKWIAWTIVALLITNTLTFFGGKLYVVKQETAALSKFNKLFEVRNELYKYYDGSIDDSKLAEGAVKGMTEALKDPYTVFMNKKEYEEFNTQTEGNYSGVGLQVQPKDEKIIIAGVFEESPAKKAGIMPKDQIVKVNGTEVSGKDIDKAVTLMKGKEGTEVTISIYREEKGLFDVKLKRQKISLVTVKGEMLNNNIGYVQVTMFDENTGKNFESKLKELQGKGMKSLVLDLRDNPGGLLNECVDMVSNFVPKDKVIVSTVDKYKNKKEYKSKGGDFNGLPIVVLTNGGTASASEIFSGAVRDYNIGTLVGKKTFGKGVVQTLLDTGEGTALKVTISKYYTPNGENINHTGINPHVDVEYPKELLQKDYDRNVDPQFNKALEIAKSKVK